MAVLWLLFSCKKENPAGPSAVVGNWRLVYFCPGSLTTPCTLLPDSKTVLLRLKADGSYDNVFTNATAQEGSFFGTGTYRFVQNQLLVRPALSSHTTPDTVLVQLRNDTLWLRHPAARYTYTRAK